MISVAGNTYRIRNLLRGSGGEWNPEARSWEFTDEGRLELLKFLARGERGVRVYRDGKEVPLSEDEGQLSLF